jgi:DNA repair photolyase
MSASVPVTGPVRGRGAVSNRTGRFESLEREDLDDGWGPSEPAPQKVLDSLTPLRTREIISRNASPDVGFTRSVNPYLGCSHGCVYCYARPSHAYMGLSPGIDFETRLFFKPDAPERLAEAFARKGYVPERIHLGANTDPYQPPERETGLTRRLLEVFDRFNHPLSLITKSALVVRDVDILGAMAQRGLVKAFVSVTTLDRSLARSMEPRAATPERRLFALGTLAAAGVPTGVGFAPVIPGLNDHELESVLERAAAAGAREAMFVLLRLPLEVRDLFAEWLAAERPDRAKRVMSLVRQMRGGRDYDADFSTRMTGQGPLAALLAARFALACRRLGLNQSRFRQRDDLFRPSADALQPDLFDPWPS